MSGSVCADAVALQSSSALLIILVLVTPVLTFKGPVLFVVADQALDMQFSEHLRREPSLGKVRNLDFQFFLFADDGVDIAGIISAGGNGTITITGNGIAPSTSSNNGVALSGSIEAQGSLSLVSVKSRSATARSAQ